MPQMERGWYRRQLLKWYDETRRDLPWRRDRDPYRVWVSEVMLQQTRVAAVEGYYARFLRQFPTVERLAAARPQNVLRAWAGLGYYSRARSLHAAARQVAAAGGFPRDYHGWLALPGIGTYTAAAVASIAFEQPHACVDGNVRRVVSRLFARHAALQEQAEALLDRRRPGDFNQAMMELGATVCLPRSPLCERCPLARGCLARNTGRVDQFPAPKARIAAKPVPLELGWVQRNGSILLARPAGTGLWPHFWSLPELPHPGLQRLRAVASFRHTVTWRNLRVKIYTARLNASSSGNAEAGLRFVDHSQLSRIPLSTPTRKALALMSDL
jgi:A/G-specific adenine glycosylase